MVRFITLFSIILAVLGCQQKEDPKADVTDDVATETVEPDVSVEAEDAQPEAQDATEAAPEIEETSEVVPDVPEAPEADTALDTAPTDAVDDSTD